MLIHPNISAKTIITEVDSDMVQMHAYDVRIDKLWKLIGSFMLSETSKAHRTKIAVEPVDGFFVLEPDTLYAFDTIHKVTMAPGEAAWIKGRSTLQRNGVIVQSAVYDAGYTGGINGTIFNAIHDYAKIAKNARVGQFLVLKAETYKLYTGEYNESSR